MPSRAKQLALLICLWPIPAMGEEVGHLGCSVGGYDVLVANEGQTTLETGDSIVWSVPFARVEGEHVLTAPLHPGGTRLLSGALEGNYLTPGVPCEIVRD